MSCGQTDKKSGKCLNWCIVSMNENSKSGPLALNLLEHKNTRNVSDLDYSYYEHLIYDQEVQTLQQET